MRETEWVRSDVGVIRCAFSYHVFSVRIRDL